MKKTLIAMFALLTFVPMIKVNALDFGKVDVLKAKDTIGDPKVSGNQSADVVVTYEGVTVKMEDPVPPAKPTSEAWVGVKVTAPSTITADVKKAKYRNIAQPNQPIKSFWENQDSNKGDESDQTRFLNFWGAIDLELLKTAVEKGTIFYYAWEFDWDGDGEFEQKVTLKVDPAKVGLKALEEDKEIWNEIIYETEEEKYVDVTVKATGIKNVPSELAEDKIRIKKEGMTKEELEAFIEKIQEALKEKGLEFGGFFTNQDLKTTFDFTKALNSDTTVYLQLKEKANEVEVPTTTLTPEKTNKAEKNPATGDSILTFALLLVVALTGTLVTAYKLKKSN